MKQIWLVVWIVIASGVRSISGQTAFVLSPLHSEDASDRRAMDKVTALAKQRKLKGVELFDRQSFRLMKDGKLLGVFVTGRVIAPGDRTNLACFVAVVETDQPPKLLLTLGGDNMYLIQRCGGPKAVGLVTNMTSEATVRVTVIYDSNLPAHNPDGTVIGHDGGETFIPIVEPIVIAWNRVTHRWAIDEKSTDLAGNAETLPAVMKALR